MSLKGIQKAFARLPQMISSQMGHSEATQDAEYHELEERFKQLDALIRKINDDTRKFKDSLTSALGFEENVAKTMVELYEPITGRRSSATEHEAAQSVGDSKSGLIAHSPESAESLQRVQDLAAALAQVRQEITPELDRLERLIIGPAADYVQMFDEVKKFMKKRDHKMLDYDRHRDAVKRLTASERDVSAEKKLARAEADLEEATRLYNNLHTTLMQELPHFFALAIHFINPSFKALYWCQYRYYHIVTSAFEGLNVPHHLKSSLTVLEAFEPMEQQQIELLGTLSIPRLRKVKSATSAELVPPASAAAGAAGDARAPSTASAGLARYATAPKSTFPGSPSESNPWSQPNSGHYTASPSAAVPPPRPPRGPAANYVTALYDYQAQANGDLSFSKGDRIELIERTEFANDWWKGRLNGNTGVFPGNYVQEL
ncbi:uncharacterized protein BJ171DRAFT_507867 [Polychytrium aggregatum]|uniref:uncharacterized protein n=1 Tax=Polychytrium aggregatum TaxID=110093 RepID=UPI0022FDFF0E|nr:uncharacterized protein BJ171DRAFT_507867 [Polychytrium aggregatum]KAI9203763.1 hypothetical protein BJ171DRAFT_507867 [Polychytrium aggregatum]